MNTQRKILSPQPGKQEMFMSTDADIAFYGGAMGGGKTFVLLLEGTRNIHVPDFTGAYFRAEIKDLIGAGAIWDQSQEIFPIVGGTPRSSKYDWKFKKTNARILFSSQDKPAKMLNKQGWQMAFIGLDELTQFNEDFFWFLVSRNRASGRAMGKIKPYIRATCNPKKNSWVRMMIDWYLDEDGLPIESRCGVIRYFIRIGEALETRLVWGDTEQEVREQARQYDIPDNIPIKTFTFINSTVYDNQILVQQSPDYLANLYAQNAVLKARMLYGNWNIDYDDFGIILNREYFPRYNLSEKMQIPGFFKETYFVIDGASKTKESNDYSVIGLAGRSNIDDKWYIIDWIREKLEEPDLEQLIIDKWHEWRSKLDNKIQFSPPRGIWIEDKSCGTGLLQRLPRKGIPCQPLKAVKDKYLRLNDGLMFIKNQFVMIPDSGNWVNKFFEELECFRKDGKHVKMNGESKEHDDQVDVLAYMISTQINTLSEVQALILPEERQNTVKKWYDM